MPSTGRQQVAGVVNDRERDAGMPRRGREREHAAIRRIGPAENMPYREPRRDENDDREEREVADRCDDRRPDLEQHGHERDDEHDRRDVRQRPGDPRRNRRARAVVTTTPASSGARIEVTTIHATADGAACTSRPKIRPITATADGTNTIETSAADASSPTTYDSRPPALSCVPGRIGGTGDTASANQRDLERMVEIERERDPDRDGRHDHAHREQRAQEQARTLHEIGEICDPRVETDAEHHQSHAALDAERDGLCDGQASAIDQCFGYSSVNTNRTPQSGPLSGASK